MLSPGSSSMALCLIGNSLVKVAPAKGRLTLSWLGPKSFLVSSHQRRLQSSQSDATVSKHDSHNMPTKTQKILTIPNILTSSRILITPAIGYFIWHDMHYWALSCFAYAALTDLADGLVARYANQSSDVGAILDPIADKLLMTTCFISLYHVDKLPLWLVGSFIIRDVALLCGGLALRYRSFTTPPTYKQLLDFNKHPAPEFDPTLLSKCNTALQCSLIVIHLSAGHLAIGSPVYGQFLTSLHALTASTTLASFGQYLFRARRKKTSFIQANPMGTNKKRD